MNNLFYVLLSFVALGGVGFSSIHQEANAAVVIYPTLGSGSPGCEETLEGCYLPSIVTVNVGDLIVFSNTDISAHTFTSGDQSNSNSIQRLFDSSIVMQGDTFDWVTKEVGNIPYLCMIHPWMTGLIIVTENGAIPVDIPTQDPSTAPPPNTLSDIEIQKLRTELANIKQDNISMKQEVRMQRNEIAALKDQIVVMTNEFVLALQNLHNWFGLQLGNNTTS